MYCLEHALAVKSILIAYLRAYCLHRHFDMFAPNARPFARPTQARLTFWA